MDPSCGQKGDDGDWQSRRCRPGKRLEELVQERYWHYWSDYCKVEVAELNREIFVDTAVVGTSGIDSYREVYFTHPID
jgi:hypothetical protein